MKKSSASYLLAGSFPANAWLHLAVITDSRILECLHHAVSAVWGWIHADIVFVFRIAVHALAGECCAARDSADCVLPFSDEPPAPLRWLGGILLMA